MNTITTKTQKATKTKTAKKVKKIDSKSKYLAQVITAENVQTIGEQTAQKALKTIYNKSADKFILSLINDLTNDLHNVKNDSAKTFSNGYDIAQTAICFYCQYIGKKLSAKANNGETDKDGNPIDIYRACLRTINRYILNNKNKVFKTVYLQDIDENGEHLAYIELPKSWDMPTITDYKQVTQAIENMRLSVTEKKILSARLRGYGNKSIAKKLCLSLSSVKTYLRRIQAKAIAIGISPQTINNMTA